MLDETLFFVSPLDLCALLLDSDYTVDIALFCCML
jgi:hypothetical protein